VIQRPDLAADPRFSDMKQRAAHRDDLTPLLDEILSTRDTAYWVDALAGKVPVSPVYDLPQALENPFAHDVGMIRNVPHPAKTDFRTFANPIKLDGQRVPAQTCAGLGANTSDLLQEVGYDPADIDGLRSDGVI
jgi:crotonobetainyl-CoA:carnitine CoA-transferase CaiB-like acyl-CoA transferase